MTQHIQFQKIFLHGVVLKMGGNLVAVRVIRRVLHRAEIPDLILLWDNHQTTGMLSRRTAHTHTAGSKPRFLRLGCRLPTLLQILFDVAKGGLLRNGANGSGTEHMGRAKHGDTVFMGFCLIFA